MAFRHVEQRLRLAAICLLTQPTAALVLLRAPTVARGRGARWSEACAELDAVCFPPSGLWKSQQYAEELESEHSEVLGAWSDGASGAKEELVGLVCCKRVIDECYLLMLSVHPDWRGRALGEALLRAALRSAWEAEQALLTLEVRESNAAALKLYAKCGLEQVGRRPRYYYGPQEDALLLTAHLNPDAPPPPPAYVAAPTSCGVEGLVLGRLGIEAASTGDR